jgi:hypothetical protein
LSLYGRLVRSKNVKRRGWIIAVITTAPNQLSVI